MKNKLFLGGFLLITSIVFLSACSSDNTITSSQKESVEQNKTASVVSDTVYLDNGDLLVEGDMIITPETQKYKALGKRNTQSALLDANNRWAAGDVIKYYFVPATPAISTDIKNEFRRALKDISSGVNVYFQEVAAPGNYVVSISFPEYISSNSLASGCSTVGKITNPRVQFSQYYKAFTSNIFIHEMLHTLGFRHEQQRINSENYINVDRTDGVNNGYITGDTLGTSFDFGSILIYDTSFVTPLVSMTESAKYWVGRLPLQSSKDQSARKQYFGSVSATQNLFSIRHAVSGKYLCRTASGASSLTMLSNYSPLCEWNVSTGTMDLTTGYRSSTLALRYDNATTISGPETVHGMSYYLSYNTSHGGLYVSASAGGRTYADKWIPISEKNGLVKLWNPSAKVCLADVGNGSLNVQTNCTEEYIRDFQIQGPLFFVYPNVQNHMSWKLIPNWSPTSPY